jgi:cell division protein FtsI (penicillin-binding protein 3)
VVVAVLVSEPTKGKYYGGDVAAPVFGAVMQQTLRLMNVPTDMDVKAQINAKPAAAEPESI